MELNCHSLKGNTMYLVQYKANCADEFDVYGFAVYDQEHLDSLNEAFDKLKKRYNTNSDNFYLNHWFGTNEAVTFDTAEEVFSAFNVKQLTGIEAQTMLILFDMNVNIPKGQFFDVADHTCEWDEENDN